MIARAEVLTAERKEMSEYQKYANISEKSKGAQFIKKLQTNAYLSSEMNLEDRLNRNRNQLHRDANYYE